jgi:large subunit ribosomal protein L30
MAAELKITLTRSLIGYEKSQRLTARALGLTKIGSTVTQQNTAPVRGMIKKITHVLTVEAADGRILSQPPKKLGRKKHYGPHEGLGVGQ